MAEAQATSKRIALAEQAAAQALDFSKIISGASARLSLASLAAEAAQTANGQMADVTDDVWSFGCGGVPSWSQGERRPRQWDVRSGCDLSSLWMCA